MSSFELSTHPRKRYPSDHPDAVRERNEKQKMKRARNEGLLEKKIKYYVENSEDHEVLLLAMEQAKKCVSEGSANMTSNYKILLKVFQYFLSHHSQTSNLLEDDNEQDCENQTPEPGVTSYQYCQKGEISENLYITTSSSIQHLIAQCHLHNKCGQCPQVTDTVRLGHAGLLTIKCSCGQFSWNTSPHIAGGKCLANMRMIHGYMMSGILPVQYERFCSAAGIGNVGNTYLKKVASVYCDVTDEQAKKSMEGAIMEEIASGDLTGINIMTDARHGWRRNAKDTDVVCIGEKTHKVLSLEHVTRREEPSSQKHELVGTRKIFEKFAEKQIPINIHVHDGNASVTKYVESRQEGVKNSYDTWHATKGITKQLRKVAQGPKRDHGKTWHVELSDKAGSIRTHIHWAMKNCDGSAQKLCDMLDNISNHYKDVHDKCHPTSRCKADPAYEPTKVKLTDPVAEKLLTNAIHNLVIYKKPEDYIYCQNTHYVESYNNATLIYHDKRIVFGTAEYRRRSSMSIIEWNENVDRDYTSVTFRESAIANRRCQGQKNLKPKTTEFFTRIWEAVLQCYY